MKKIMKSILFVCLCLNLANCEEGGGGNSTTPSTGSLKTEGNFIPDDLTALGPIAQHLVNNDAEFDAFFNQVNAGNGEKAYSDSQLLFAIRAYLNAKTKTVDVQGEMDVLSETPFDAYLEAVYTADGSSRGVSARGLCYLTSDMLKSFGIENSVVLVDGVAHAHAPGGQYCVVEAHLPNGDVMIDSYLNRSWEHLDHGYFLSSTQMAQVIADNTLRDLVPTPDGFANALPSWSPLNGFYHSYEAIAFATVDQEKAAEDVYEATFDSITVVENDDLRN